MNSQATNAAPSQDESLRTKRGRFARQRPVILTVLVRKQNVEEQKRFNAAFDLILSEIVRQHLSREEIV